MTDSLSNTTSSTKCFFCFVGYISYLQLKFLYSFKSCHYGISLVQNQRYWCIAMGVTFDDDWVLKIFFHTNKSTSYTHTYKLTQPHRFQTLSKKNVRTKKILAS